MTSVSRTFGTISKSLAGSAQTTLHGMALTWAGPEAFFVL